MAGVGTEIQVVSSNEATDTKVVKIGKQRVGYRSFGSGRPLVMIMGLGGTMGSWDPTFLDALAAGGHRIVLLDNEGVGFALDRCRRRRLAFGISHSRAFGRTAGEQERQYESGRR